MSILDQIKADREAGTPGPWVNEVIYGWGDTPCIRVDGMEKPFINFIRPKSYHTEYVKTEDWSLILSESRARKAGNYVPTKEHREQVVAAQDADARRIARVPQLERIALAAEAMAQAIEATNKAVSDWADTFPYDDEDGEAASQAAENTLRRMEAKQLEALAEFREACK